MNKRGAYVGGAFVLLFIILLVYLFSGEDTTKPEVKAFVSDRWEKEFLLEDKTPMGLHLFKQMVDNRSGNSVVVKDSLENYMEDSLNTFVFVGDQFSVYTDELDSILKKVEKGSDLFLSFHTLTNNLTEYFFYDMIDDWHFEEDVTVHTDKRSYDLYSVFQTDTVARVWKLFNPANLIDTNHEVYSYIMETPNFVCLKLGKGKVYLHSTPELFYNYQLLTKDGFNHALYFVHQMKEKQPVKWLELGRLSTDFGNSDTDEMEGQEGRKDESMLQFLFKKKELLIALLLTILGLILYLIFRTKRYWPIIPYLPKSKNRSLDFADTMTAIYYTQQSPYSILIVMRKNFRAIINKQFFMDISKPDKTREISILAEKSGIELSRIERLITMLENAKMKAVTYEYIQEAASLQREFYLETGIIKDKVKIKSRKKKIVFRRQMLVAILLMFFGINVVLRGFYYLADSNGLGIVFWPLGVVLLVLGGILFSRKLMVADQQELVYYPYFTKKKVFQLDEIMDVKTGKGFTLIEFTGNRKLKINHFEISRYNRKDFEQFIAPFLKLK